MNSREKILSSIVTGKPEALPHPGVAPSFANGDTDLAALFTRTLEGIGGQVMKVTDYGTVRKHIAEAKQRGEWIVNASEELGEVSTDVGPGMVAPQLAAIDRAFLKSSMGVAENGSVWLKESEMLNRLLPFICQHLVIVLDARNLVADMHQAYKKIEFTDAGYHLFLAGPSKTADIEQSLVIGAHGARSLLVYLVG